MGEYWTDGEKFDETTAGSGGVHGCFLDTRTGSDEMDRATLSYNPPLKGAIFRRLMRAPHVHAALDARAGALGVGQCLPDSSRSQ